MRKLKISSSRLSFDDSCENFIYLQIFLMSIFYNECRVIQSIVLRPEINTLIRFTHKEIDN